jgi:hypothetical protein
MFLPMASEGSCLLTLTIQKELLQTLTYGSYSYYFSGCQAGVLQKTNTLTILSNSRLSVASEPRGIPEGECNALLRYIASFVIDVNVNLNFVQVKMKQIKVN